MTAGKPTMIGLAEAASKLPELVAQVQRGEEVVIERAGQVVARIVPATGHRTDRSAFLGSLRGKAWIANDFDAPLPETMLNAFEGRDGPTRS